MTSERVLRDHLYLIGDTKSNITGNKLPSNLEILKVSFHNTRHLNLNVQDSVNKVYKELLLYWQKSCIATQSEKTVKKKLASLYEEYRTLQKRKSSGFNQQAEDDFVGKLNLLFDIASSNALNDSDEEKRTFLINQRSTERRGTLLGLTVNSSSTDLLGI